MKGLILAAGKGKRLKTVFSKIPKSLISICGKPMISYGISAIEAAGVNDIGIVVSWKEKKRISGFLGKKYEYITQAGPHGTASAIYAAKDFIGKSEFIVLYCDNVFFYNLRKIVSFHKKHKSPATLLIQKAPDPRITSQVLLRGDFVAKIKEKTKEKISKWEVAGALLFTPKIFEAIKKNKPSAQDPAFSPKRVAQSPALSSERAGQREYHIADAIQYLVDLKEKVRWVKIDTWRVNVNSKKDIQKAEDLIRKEK